MTTVLSLVLALAVQPQPVAPAVERARVLALADSRSADIPALQALARSTSPRVRADVARALGHLASAEAAAVAAAMAADPAPGVRASACRSLGRLLAALGPGTEGRDRLVGAVRTHLADAEPEVRGAAAWAVGAAAEEALVPAVLERVAAEGDGGVRAALVQELWRLPGTLWVCPAVAAAADAEPRVRLAAAVTLGRSHAAQAAAALCRLAADPDPQVRVAALGAVRRGTAAGLEDAVTAAVADGDERVRIAALDALAVLLESGGAVVLPEAVLGRLAAATGDGSPVRVHERVMAIRAAGRAGCCGVELRRTAEGAEAWVADEALEAWARQGGEPAAALVHERLGSEDAAVRRAAVRAAALLPDGAAAVAAALADSDAGVRLAAVEVAAGLDAETVTAALAARLDDGDAAVRAAAVGALGERDALPPLPRLVALLAREHGATVPDSAVALIEAIAAADDAAGEAVESVLGDLAGSPDPVVSRAAWAALAALGAELPLPTVDTGNNEDFYAEVVSWAGQPRWLEIVTVRGTIVVELDTAEAPLTTFTLARLAEQEYFDGLSIHRVVPDFVVQGGDPRGDGWGGPGFVLRDELSGTPYDAGVVGMALAGPDTGGSQLFVTLTPQPHLDGRYPVIGRLVWGLEVAARLRRGDRILRARAAEAEPPEPVAVRYGSLTPEDLDGLPGWVKERAEYTGDPRWLALLRSASLRYGIEVAMGSWCSDSREQLPRLQAVLAALGASSPFSAPVVWGVDRSKAAGLVDWRHGVVDKVPTVVVTFEGAEIGRIVETPSWGSIEEDLARIVAPFEGFVVDEVPATEAMGGKDG